MAFTEDPLGSFDDLNIREFLWLAELLLASQEGLCSMELLIKIHI
jgi:hypothetical protein